MRGTSRREDAAFWVVKISQNHDFSELRIGTMFASSFTKNRDDGGLREKSIDWSFVTTNDHTEVTWRPTDTKELVYELIKQGVDSNGDIADELGITKGTVSFHINRLVAENLVKKQGAHYVIV
ncbi:MAG: winged helix-turn-helix domain-containing protein [Puniceicoccales bacterium]|jgi:DNA-binding NarL/FixJ family response regulator|nr:winged helix-turn-helix domain-containing protein [Puniceicoccales bacterium]